MNRSEAKFKNTANKMNAALITLLEFKDFKDITIMDICKEAGVNRSTFYSHYSNTYDLLKEAQEGIIANFVNELEVESPVNLKDINNIDKKELNFITPKYLLPYLKYIESHKKLFKIFISNSNTFEMNDLNDSMKNSILVPILAKYKVYDDKLITYMQKYFLSGIHAIISEWVLNNCEDDILFICEIITFCVRPN